MSVESVKNRLSRLFKLILLTCFVFFIVSGFYIFPFSNVNEQHQNFILPSPSIPISFDNRTIVVTRYKEDITWLDLYLHHINHVVYTKEDAFALHNIPINKGKEIMVYLKYIIDYYDRLPGVVAFIHGHRFAWHLKEPDDIVKSLRALKWGRFDYMPLQAFYVTNTQIIRDSPNPQYAFNWKFWNDTLRDIVWPPADYIECPCCATIAVKKHLILARTKQFYLRLYNYISNSTESSDRLALTLEYVWHIIFGQPFKIPKYQPCDLFYCYENGTIKDCARVECTNVNFTVQANTSVCNLDAHRNLICVPTGR
ncbi:unnamed protein product [Didymodactylos carnosus]|uniref:Uncharacterized protein n=1 Tax=Didymodactylos carnosus TaxID=1234261 RepID=A0A814J0Y1_9BILA|nr:unnamed protein product [Didymodactylos carnosus]CAF1163196.1 unnamed protein product [Didymodactylos carnosus]CAF3802470.1 unnamed protein product [Didymodactylos carnosus]CAF3974875.1 unnamed protein product [Didymodactylos carnosus]